MQNGLEFLLEICPYKQAFDCLYNLLLISVTLPVTTASCERNFRKKIVKTFLGNSMWHYRLSNLALLSIESILAESIELEQFVNEFDSRHENRRIKLPDFERQCRQYIKQFSLAFNR